MKSTLQPPPSALPGPAGRLYDRRKRVHDRAVRCYLTLACPLACPFCSAGIPELDPARRAVRIEPAAWAAGINRRRRHTILAGGEPLAYEGIGALVRSIDPAVRLGIYTNAVPNTQSVIQAGRPLDWLISFHAGVCNVGAWLANVRRIVNAGQRVRFHLVKDETWRQRLAVLVRNFPLYRVTVCDDQRAGARSTGPLRPVRCTLFCDLYGPDGYRYPCVTLLGRGEQRQEHITAPDGPAGFTVDCARFGSCVGCDNNIEGRSEELA